ncbi:anti-repressor SinI family protein [Metabacillus sp. GX 13764]|nr:DNA-binding anti-repressor SinI [Metabacillus kandeliae]MCD7033166.1 anti-repressor SinI family protein [Metabacillus kandeliae]
MTIELAKPIDEEWLDLMMEAERIGLTVEEVRVFLRGEKNA